MRSELTINPEIGAQRTRSDSSFLRYETIDLSIEIDDESAT